MRTELRSLVEDFAEALMHADAKRPQAVNARSKVPFQPGIGPHAESEAVRLVAAELELLMPARYEGEVATSIPYPEAPRHRCDLCLGNRPDWEWAVEVKMLRFLGDNGQLNDNILMHILSPYPAHRSALTDCVKLVNSSLGSHKAVLIYGFDHQDWPLKPAIDAFALLAKARVRLGSMYRAEFHNLIHPVHSSGQVFAWEVKALRDESQGRYLR